MTVTDSVEVLLRLLDGGVSCFSLPLPLSLSSLHRRIEELHGVPSGLQRLHVDGRPLWEGSGGGPPPSASSFLCVSLSLSLLGGKGGFGTLLRATTSQVGAKRTTDFSAMRDLHGRRRRHVEQERELEEWKAREEGKSDDDRRRERREAQQRMAQLNKGSTPAHLQACKWGLQCRYKDTSCRRRHSEEEEKEAGDGRAGKRRKDGSGAAVGVFDSSWQAQVVDEEEMREDLQLGLRHREGGGGGGHWLDTPSDDEEEEEEDERKEGRTEMGKVVQPRTSSPPLLSWGAEEQEETKEEGRGASGDAAEEERKDGGLGAPLAGATARPSPTPLPVPSPSSATSSIPSSSSSSSPSPSLFPTPDHFPPVDLSLHPSAVSLESLGLPRLSAELHRRGLKTGGRLSERAERLFFCKGRAMDDIPNKMRATTSSSSRAQGSARLTS